MQNQSEQNFVRYRYQSEQNFGTMHAGQASSCMHAGLPVPLLQLRSRRTFLRELTLWNYYSPRTRTPQHGSVRTRDVNRDLTCTSTCTGLVYRLSLPQLSTSYTLAQRGALIPHTPICPLEHSPALLLTRALRLRHHARHLGVIIAALGALPARALTSMVLLML